jgi:hypothetical protein
MGFLFTSSEQNSVDKEVIDFGETGREDVWQAPTFQVKGLSKVLIQVM